MDQLRSFVAVSQLGSVTQASQLIGRSQPAISLQLTRLHERIGMPLFQRSGHRLELTDNGRLVLGYAEKILALNG